MDIDGTLLNKGGTVSDEDKQALARVVSSGIKVSLASGRSVTACLPLINELGLDGFHTTFDGALVSDPKLNHEVFAEPISAAMVEKIIAYAHDSGIDIELYSDNRLFIERDSWMGDVRRQAFHSQPIITDFALIEREERIIKGTIVARSAAEKKKAASFRRQFGDTLCFSTNRTPTFPGVDFVNVLAPGVSKGNAIEILTSFIDIALDEVMAVGDGANDASILSRVGFAVAMGDASDELKAIAHHVTLDAEHSGVAKAVNRVIFAR
ncbi:MAG: Cof-type HAD-IIB family hydrolase [Dehalococcoidales bacterium]|nr:Cof-type HAD-IIB family hydrolase [Dehalococcoidales bacterium]